MPASVTVGSYSWATADDQTGYDPSRWLLGGSHDGYEWTTLDDAHETTPFVASSARQSWQGPFDETRNNTLYCPRGAI